MQYKIFDKLMYNNIRVNRHQKMSSGLFDEETPYSV